MPKDSNLKPVKNFDIRKNFSKLGLKTATEGFCLFKDRKFIVADTDIAIFAEKVNEGAEIK
eukprot:TRINITY_DN3687_c0_g1_i1.p1 TRINITY_DN3687_c0_g1~~TRINITY_DN3687_c0_g1_i1.p1  ORF type:complete len:61 (+),score=12.78 TRINITY_DN3687_c0_g1_i1:34-216(+)